MRTPRQAKLLKFAPALLLLALALPSPAFGLPKRTWVSDTGDNANPCSHTEPCANFAGALDKTARGGVINCLGPGGYASVVIDKSITIKCSGREGGIVAAGGNGIVINTPPKGKVTLKGLDINGAGTGPKTAGVGIKVLRASNVQILDSEITRFKTGIASIPGQYEPFSSVTRVVVVDSHIHDNGAGVISGPLSEAPSRSQVTTLRNNVIADNVCGVVTDSYGVELTHGAPDPNHQQFGECGGFYYVGIELPTTTRIFGNGIYDNGVGVFVRGPQALALVGHNEITGNTRFGMHTLDTGTLRVYTPATNVIDDNAASDPPNSMVALTKR